ncbi:hypothetical protein [Streptomyces sp. NPDC004296]|uniref:hypothetical protein n=1 Tax=Streptomyces sp. NPDC004296 TaxID=3364697 RepID=UPI0036AF4F2B
MIAARVKKFTASVAIAGGMAAAALALTTGPASAAPASTSLSYHNLHITTYDNDPGKCAWQRDRLNRWANYPVNDQYYYCGGATGTELWLRELN